MISRLASYHGSYSSSDLDFIRDLRDSLTKVPLALQDTQAATFVIRILTSELLYSHETLLTRVLGLKLCNVLEAVKLSRDLTVEEMRAIYSLAMRRLERSVESSYFCCLISITSQVIHRRPGYFADHGKWRSSVYVRWHSRG